MWHVQVLPTLAAAARTEPPRRRWLLRFEPRGARMVRIRARIGIEFYADRNARAHSSFACVGLAKATDAEVHNAAQLARRKRRGCDRYIAHRESVHAICAADSLASKGFRGRPTACERAIGAGREADDEGAERGSGLASSPIVGPTRRVRCRSRIS